MITVALSTTISAPHDRVWRAMVDPAEREAWDERILGRVEGRSDPRAARRAARARSEAKSEAKSAASGAARSGEAASESRAKEPLRRTRWRFKLGNVPQVLDEEIVEAHHDRTDRLTSRVTMGSLHFDQKLTLHVEDDETGPRTRLSMKVVATNSIAVIGEVVPRLDVQKLVIEYVDATLRQVRKHCESEG